MFDNFLFKFKDTIGYLLFKKIFYGYILLVLSISAYQIYTEYNFAKKLIFSELKNSEKAFSTILAKSVWHFDEELIVSQTKAILTDSKISGLSIISSNDEIIVLNGNISNEMNKYTESVFTNSYLNKPKYKANLLEHKFDLVNQEDSPDEILAEVTFYIENSIVYEILEESVSLILFNVIVSALGLWLLFIYFANKLLAQPLRQLIKATQELSENEYTETKIVFNTNRRHELNKLNDNFNKMSTHIQESIINLKQLTIIQNKQKEALEEANKYKTDFLANVSHELKTPLNSINVISSVMMKNKKGALSQEQVKNLKIINNCGNNLLFLINDVLDISKLEAGEISLNLKQFDFKKLINDIKDMIEPQAKEKNINFTLKCDESIGDIYSDDNRIKQIVINLLSNALKFAKDGNIELIVKDENEDIEIHVKDDGIGISQENLEHIFDRFKQADGSTTRKFGGTGLGLAISKELLDLLKGTISVQSKLNEGTTFTIKFPKNKQNIKEKKEEKIINIQKTTNNKILILNNDPVAFLSLFVELKKSYEIQNVKNLIEFLNFYKEAEYSNFIIDISTLKQEDLKKVLSHVKEKVVLVHNKNESIENFQEYSKFTLAKPFDKDDINSLLNLL